MGNVVDSKIPLSSKSNLRLTTFKLDRDTDAMLKVLMKKKAQAMSVIIREAIRVYYTLVMGADNRSGTK